MDIHYFNDAQIVDFLNFLDISTKRVSFEVFPANIYKL